MSLASRAIKTLLQRPAAISLAIGGSSLLAYTTLSPKAMAAEAAFNVDKYESLLPKGSLGRPLHYMEKVDTTMKVADEAFKAKGNDAHGSVYLAEEQTAGVGRRGRDWASARESNLYFSFVYAPKADNPAQVLEEMRRLNFAISLATAKACIKAGAEDAKVKWPNDVWINNQKVSGMLVNYNGRTGGVAGVGINVNQQFTHAVQLPAVSIAQATGKLQSREQVLAWFFTELSGLMAKSFTELLEEYRRYDLLDGQMVRVYHKQRGVDDERDFDAKVTGFNSDGSLVVQDANGKVFDLSGEEISIRPQ